MEDIEIIHLTGTDDYWWVSRQYQNLGFSACVRAFEPQMKDVLDAVDLAVARSGASTLAELAARGTPAVLIPYPFAVADHQTKNARAVEDDGAAVGFKNE